MKRLGSGEILEYHSFVKIFSFSLLAFLFFYLGKHWSPESRQLVFFNRQGPVNTPYIAISPNINRTFDISAVISRNSTDSIDDRNSSLNSTLPLSANSESPPSPPPPVSPLESRFGIIDENGTMQEQFEVGQADPDLLDNLENNTETQEKGEKDDKSRVTVGKFSICSESMTDYIPCLDNLEEIKKLKSIAKGENFERHCPAGNHALKCLIPRPKGYKKPIKWPKSRDEVWFNNVPHTRLVQDKGGQNWISRKGDKFTFPGGGTQFIHGADQYLDQISKMVPDISFGHRSRVALDVGCGVASFGAFLLSRNVTTLSIGPKDAHENQIQFALERGVPSMLSAFATRRLLYPSQAFDFIHCSRCRINWLRDDGILLLEANRMLRAGGYFLWAAQPVYKHDEEQQEVWKEMEDLTSRICWVLVKKEGYLAIWKKPSNNSCYLNREDGLQPPLCDTNDDPDAVWYVDLKPCITRLPDNGYGSNITTWPKRLDLPPDRLQMVEMDFYIARTEFFMAENRYWKEVIDGYAGAFHWRDYGLRNVMDMKAGFGGFAAAILHLPIDCWVMNVVPISGPNTLPVIYDRGLIGVSHDWCEPFDTYPRTYDFLHAAGLFSIERKRCNITNILLEMDRILRPGGRAYIRDTIDVIEEVHQIVKAVGWRTQLRDTGEGPQASWRFIIGEKEDP